MRARARCRGASGQTYEVDLALEATLAGVAVVILVECKCYTGKVGLDEVTEFAYKIRDIGAHKGILVASSGFQSGAIRVAKREGIALVEAVSSWFVIAPCLLRAPAEYVIYDREREGTFPLARSYRLPKGSTLPKDAMPFSRYMTAPISQHRHDAEVGFFPAIEGIYGEPMNLLRAAEVFCIEESVDPGVLSSMRIMPSV